MQELDGKAISKVEWKYQKPFAPSSTFFFRQDSIILGANGIRPLMIQMHFPIYGTMTPHCQVIQHHPILI
jgi:hypothetical protein